MSTVTTAPTPTPSDTKITDRVLKFELWAVRILFTAALAGGLLFGYILSEVRGSDTIDLLTEYQPSVPTVLYDINGEVISELFRHKQQVSKYSQLPPHLTYAFLSVEDQNFYNHFGLDFIAILRAAIVNIANFGIVQGGSTLTQQVAKVITAKTQKTFIRKFYEAILALQIESQFSKEEILELYFNSIYLGHGTRGVRAAAKLYFEKDVEDLSLAEAGVLARLPKAPVNYSPFRYPNKAKNAHKVVLNLMEDQGFISKEKIAATYDSFWDEYWGKIIMRSPSQTTFGGRKDLAPYFTEYVREMLVRNEAVGEDKLYADGLKVYTTLDLSVQRAAKQKIDEQLVESDKIARRQMRLYIKGADPELVGAYGVLRRFLRLPEIDKKEQSFQQKYREYVKKELLKESQILALVGGSNNAQAALLEFDSATQIHKENLHVQGAFIGIDHRTGHILGMVGGRDYSSKNQFNRTLQARRQPGSAFKPFVYGALIDSGLMHSAQSMLNTPTVEVGEGGVSWAVENYEGGFSGRVTLEFALFQSLNIVAVRAYNYLGPDPIVNFASKLMQIKDSSRFIPAPTLALGASEITPLEMAKGYAVFANDGKEVIPYAIRYVTDNQGNIILNRERDVQNILAIKEKNGTIQVISPETAWIMRHLMQKVVNSGTGRYGIRTEGKFKGDAAGKTGTTSGWYDAWYAGYTPDITHVVWLGFDRRTISLGKHQAGGTIAGPIMGRILSEVYKTRPMLKFDKEVPKGVKKTSACKNTGLKPCGFCKQLTTGYYVVNQKSKVKFETMCDYEHKKSIKFEDLLQKSYEIKNEEINKKSGFKD